MDGRSPYGKGHRVGLCVNDTCDKPLTIPLTPEYVRVYRTRFLGHKFVSCGGPE